VKGHFVQKLLSVYTHGTQWTDYSTKVVSENVQKGMAATF